MAIGCACPHQQRQALNKLFELRRALLLVHESSIGQAVKGGVQLGSLIGEETLDGEGRLFSLLLGQLTGGYVHMSTQHPDGGSRAVAQGHSAAAYPYR